MLERHTAAETLAQTRRQLARPRLKYEDRVGACFGLFGLGIPGHFDWATWRDQVLPSATQGLGSARCCRACHWPEPSERLHLPAKQLPEPPSKSTWPFAFQPSPDHCSILLPAQKPSWPLVNPTCFFSNHARFPSKRRSLRLLPRPTRYSVRFDCNHRLPAPSGSSGVLSRQGVVLFFSQRPLLAGLIFGRRPIIGAAPTYAVPRLRPDRLFTNSVTTGRILRR